MKITEVQIMPIKANKGLVAFASILFDNCLYLGSIGVYRRIKGNGYRLTYPNKIVGNKNMDIYHPINKEVGSAIEKSIIKEVEKILGP